jgi:hypothetical protein
MPQDVIRSFLGPNPFPKEDPRHESYIALGRIMTEADARNRADLLQRATTAKDEELPGLVVERAVASFDLGATVLVYGLPAHKQLELCQEALVACAGQMLATVREQIGKRPNLWGPETAKTMADLRLRLDARLAHWTAEALMQAREMQKATSLPPTGVARSESASERRKPKSVRYPRRAEWLRGHLDARKWSVHDLERAGGPSWKTARRILEGANVRETALEKIRQALSTKRVAPIGAIPMD